MIGKPKQTTMKPLMFFAALTLAGSLAAQPLERLTLEDALQFSRDNYPVIKQKDLVRQTAAISIDNLQKGFLPQLAFSGQATYQSEVTRVPISVPGFSIEPPSKDQYKLVADLSQLIYDGGLTREQKALQQLNADVEDQKLEVELYKLRERVNQVYLSILYLDEQARQVELVKKDIENGMNKVDAQVKNGVAFRSSFNMLRAEWLKTEQRAVEIRSGRRGLLDALSLLTGKELAEGTKLEKPVVAAPSYTEAIGRPELKLYDDQEKLVNSQEKLIVAKNLPKASLFAQGGYGRPGLNMLQNQFDLFFIGGLRFNWSLGGLYTRKKEREQVAVNRKQVELQKSTFLLNTRTQLKQQEAEIRKLEELVTGDDQIIELRRTVTQAANAQLENGVITANDYLKEVNAEDQARQSKIAHELQLLQARIVYQTLSGKQ